MRRLLAIAMLLVSPLVAGQSLLGVDPQQQVELLREQAAASGNSWQSGPAAGWHLQSQQLSPVQTMASGSNLPFGIVGAQPGERTQLQIPLAAHIQAQASVTQRNWVNASVPVTESEIGADIWQGPYSLGFSVGGTTLSSRAAALPRLLSSAAASGLPYPGFAGSTQFNAVGRVMLDGQNSIHVGASVGHVDLIAAGGGGWNSLDQKALSFGIEHGPVSGMLIGRMMQPTDPGAMGTPFGLDRRWSSLDFGVTWRLPWQGQISVGAHNLWSSAPPVGTATGPAAALQDQSRTPYVQYHQDL